MKVNFYEAFLRHAEDAELLMCGERWANADHHFGLAAECGLKAILLQQGIPSDQGDIERSYKKYRTHINDLWDTYQTYMQTKTVFLIVCENPFQDWHIAQRYAPEGSITEQTALNHSIAVNKIKEIIRKAELDGVLP